MILRCPCTWAEPPNREEYSMSEQVDNIEADKAYPGKFDESRYRGFIIKNKKDHAFFYCKYSIKGYEHLGAWRKIIWVKDYIDCRDAKLKKFKASKERKQVVTEVAQ
jgi:hypothetical protein